MRTDQSRLRRPGIAAAIAVLAVAGIVGGVSVAGATENTTIYSVENGGVSPCFSTVKKTTCAADEQPGRHDPDRRHGHVGLQLRRDAQRGVQARHRANAAWTRPQVTG